MSEFESATREYEPTAAADEQTMSASRETVDRSDVEPTPFGANRAQARAGAD